MRFSFHPALLGLLALVAGLCLPIILHQGETSYTADETRFYVPAIARLRAEWPKLDLRQDSLSATAPGYQYVLASLSLFTGSDLVRLRLLNLAVSLSVLVVVWQVRARDAGGAAPFAALLPLAASNFFIKSASCVVTDNAALLAIGGSLVLALAVQQKSTLPWAGATATLAVFFRQNTAWLELPLLLRARAAGRLRDAWPLLLPAALLLLLVLTWGGLVPPAWQEQHSGKIVFAAGAYHLAVLAGTGFFYFAAIRPDWRQSLREPWAWWGALLGFLLAVAGPTNPSYDAGRWGGYLWDVAARLPVIADRSLLFLLLAPVGGFVLGLLTRSLWLAGDRDRGLIWIGAQAAFLLSGLANRQVYHRYFEPPQLVLLIIWLALMAQARPAGAPPLRWPPLILLGLGQFGLTLLTAYGRTYHWL